MTAPKKQPSQLVAVLFLLPAIESLLAIAAVFLAPSEGANAWLLGLSKTRWLLVLGLLAIGVGFSLVYWRIGNLGNFQKKIAYQIAELAKSNWYWITLAAYFLATVLFFYLSLLSFTFTDQLIQSRLLRLLPLLSLLFLVSLQTGLLLPSFRPSSKNVGLNFSQILVPAAAALAVLGAVYLTVSVTRLGLEPDRTGWDVPGVPLMATQVLLAWVLAVVLVLATNLVYKKIRLSFSRIDWLVCGVLWLVALLAWQSQPLSATFFSPKPLAPNFETYPYSDAATHDLVAQNLLIGEGFGFAAEKPIYGLFLAGAHVLVGQDYEDVVTLQMIVLALFPAILYLLGSKVHHRFSGLVLALVIIFREANTIALSGKISVSHSKLLMTDLPTAFALACFCLLVLRWLRSDVRLLRWPLLVGGALGAILLLRSQTLVFLPFVMVVAFWRPRANGLRSRFVYAGLLLLGFVLVSLPWMVRNQVVTGQFGLSQPFQGLYLAKQYSLTPEANDPGFPPETPPSQYSSLGFARVLDFTRTYPLEVARFVTAHFLHNEISSFLSLPIRFDLADKIVSFYNLQPYWVGRESQLWSQCCALDTHIANNPYWNNWDGAFPPPAVLPIAVNLILLSIGVGTAWQRQRWLGLTPLGMHIVYNASTAIARVSGWRLNLPVDWVLLLYYCLGIGQLTIWAWRFFSKSSQQLEPRPRKRIQFGWQAEKMNGLALALLFAGLLLPAAEVLAPSRFEKIDARSAVTRWQDSEVSAATSLDIRAFLDQPDAVVLSGRALWPRYYNADTGEPGGQWPAFNPLPFARIGFVLIGPSGAQVVLPLETSPADFPNASDVVVYGCDEGQYIRAVAVLFSNDQAPDLLTDFHTYSCEQAP